MNTKKIKNYLIYLATALAISGIIGGSVAALFQTNVISNNLQLDNNKPVEFNGIQFDNKKEALDYATNLITRESLSAANKDFWSINMNSASYIFESPTELNNFLNSQIKVLNTTTDVYRDKLNLSDNSIVNSQLPEYNIDTKNMEVINPSFANIYEAKNDVFTYALASTNENEELNNNFVALQKAKDSYLEIHRSYYFNGIYFKTKQDLEIYLRKIYVNQAIGQKEDTANFRKIISAKNNSIRSNPIDFTPYLTDDSSEQNLTQRKKINLDISKFLNKNVYEYIKLNQNNKDSYIQINDDALNFEDVQDISIADLPVISLKANANKSLYIVDADYHEEYNLFGPYFLETNGLIENITNKSLWSVTNDSPEQIVKSQAVDVFSGFLDLFLLEPGTNWSERSFGFSYDSNGAQVLNDSNLLFYVTKYDDTNKLKKIEENMYLELKKVSGDDGITLYDLFISMIEKLVQTKSFSSFYAIPTTYAFLIEMLVKSHAPLSTYLAVKEYFLEVCDLYDSILFSLFGKDILTRYGALYSNNEFMEQEIFSFSTFFGISEYGFDFNKLANILSGNQFIRDYKQLFAASYVYVQAIANSQRNFKINYNVVDDNTILNVLAEGNDSNQNTPKKIKQKFLLNINGTSIYDKLQAIYDLTGEMSHIIDKEIKEKLLTDRIPLNNEFFNKCESKIQYYENEPLSNEFVKKVNELWNILGSKQNNKSLSKYQKCSKEIFEKSFKSKQTTKIKTSIKMSQKLMSSFDLNHFVDEFDSLNSLPYDQKNKLLKQMKSDFSYQQEIEVTYQTSYDYLSKAESISEISQEAKLEKENNTKPKKLDMLVAGINVGKTVFNTIDQIVSTTKNDFYPDHIKSQIIAVSTMNMLSSICNITSKFMPAPFGVIVKGVAGIFSLISGVIGTPKQEIYEFKLQEPDGKIVKYYWDGGLVMNRLFGLIKDQVRGIDDLKLISPIQITNPRNKDVIFFDSKFYENGDQTSLKKQVIRKILEDNISGYNVKKVYSLNKNLSNEYVEQDTSNTFELLFDNNLNNKNTLSQYIIELAIADIKTIGAKSHYIGLVDNEIFFNGYKFTSKPEFEDYMSSKILDVIRPVYVAQLPFLDESNYPLDSFLQPKFQFPYPYFEPSNEEGKQIVEDPLLLGEKSNGSTREYIISNSNEYIDGNHLSEIKIANNITTIFRNSFNVKSKTVLRNSVLKNSRYSQFWVDRYNTQIYAVDSFKGNPKYFLTKEDANNYIIKNLNLIDNDFKLQTVDYEIMTIIDKFNNKLYFNNYNEFLKWFDTQVTDLKEKYND